MEVDAGGGDVGACEEVRSEALAGESGLESGVRWEEPGGEAAGGRRGGRAFDDGVAEVREFGGEDGGGGGVFEDRRVLVEVGVGEGGEDLGEMLAREVGGGEEDALAWRGCEHGGRTVKHGSEERGRACGVVRL